MKFRHGAMTGSLNPDAGGGIYFTRDGAPVAALAMYYAVNEAKAVKVWPGEGFGRIVALDLQDAIPAYEQYKLASADFTKGGGVFKLKVGNTWYERSANKRQIEYDIVSRQLVFTDNMGPLADSILRGESLQFALEMAGWTQTYTPPRNEVYKEQTWVGTFSAISTVDVYLGADWAGDTRCAACVEFSPEDAYGEAMAWAKAINAHPEVKKLVTAEALSGYVSLVAVKKGPDGNAITLATNDRSVTLKDTHLNDGVNELPSINLYWTKIPGDAGEHTFIIDGHKFSMWLRHDADGDGVYSDEERMSDNYRIEALKNSINAAGLRCAAKHHVYGANYLWGLELYAKSSVDSDVSVYLEKAGGKGHILDWGNGFKEGETRTLRSNKRSARGGFYVHSTLKPEANASVTIGGHKVLRYGKGSGRELVSVQGQDARSSGKKHSSYSRWGEEKTLEGEMRGGAVSLVGGRDKAIVRVTHPRNSTWFTRRVANIYIRS